MPHVFTLPVQDVWDTEMWYELMTLDPAMAAERRSFGFSIAQDDVALTASLGGYARRHPRNTHHHDIKLHHLSPSL